MEYYFHREIKATVH